jgi:hypothetical protein
LLINELLGDPNKARDTLDQGLDFYHVPFPEKLQWMVFKVKKRAKSDYFTAIGSDRAFAVSRPFYTHNWPYDHFSLVELAQIQTDVEFGAFDVEPKPAVVANNIEEQITVPGRPAGMIPYNLGSEASQSKMAASGVDLSGFESAQGVRSATDTTDTKGGISAAGIFLGSGKQIAPISTQGTTTTVTTTTTTTDGKK